MSHGRGRGQLTFNAELLGIGRGDAPSSVLTPPPKYPPRLGKPRPLVDNDEQDFLVATGKNFAIHMRASPFFIKSSKEKQQRGIERFHDRFEDAEEAPLELDWSRFPQELRPDYRKRMARKRKASEDRARKRRQEAKDVSKKLEELEKKEGEEKSDDDEDVKEKKDDSDDEKPKDNIEESDVEEVDEEMDEGTDYANNYFDNGDGYLDEDDDNLDEGGIY